MRQYYTCQVFDKTDPGSLPSPSPPLHLTPSGPGQSSHIFYFCPFLAFSLHISSMCSPSSYPSPHHLHSYLMKPQHLLYCIVLYSQPVLNPKSYDGTRVLEAAPTLQRRPLTSCTSSTSLHSSPPMAAGSYKYVIE